MNIQIKRSTCDGDTVCFNHAVFAAMKGVPIIETIPSDYYSSCDWCENGVPLEIQGMVIKGDYNHA